MVYTTSSTYYCLFTHVMLLLTQTVWKMTSSSYSYLSRTEPSPESHCLGPPIIKLLVRPPLQGPIEVANFLFEEPTKRTIADSVQNVVEEAISIRKVSHVRTLLCGPTRLPPA